MKQVDFAYVDPYGATIYRTCFEIYLRARYILERPEAEWSELGTKVEQVFDLLVKEGNDNGFNVNSILKVPDSSGSTCYSIASGCSEKICNYIIERGVEVNSITIDMMVPQFKYPDLAITMMMKGISPYVIDCYGNSQVVFYPSSFKSEEAKSLLAKSPRSIHFSIEDIECDESCPADCSSEFKKFYFKNGTLVEMTEENRIGSGGFGMVFRQFFHGMPMAMKCVLLGKIEFRQKLRDIISDLERNISEIRVQIATAGSGIIAPVAFVRQQNQEQDANGKWISKNYNVYIYPLYDCNLYEFHQNHFDQFTEEIVADVINQCFVRTGCGKSYQKCANSPNSRTASTCCSVDPDREGLLICFESKRLTTFWNHYNSLETLDRHNRTHNDIKPQNFLVKIKNGSNDLTEIEIVLTDFGMAEPDSKGGTPIFASPECFETKDKRSDIFSFGRVILFLLLTKDRFIKWLFVPLKEDIRSLSLRILTLARADHSLDLVSQMTTLNDRMNLQASRKLFDSLRKQSEISIKPVLIKIIDTIINAEISNNDKIYFSELCDFRYGLQTVTYSLL